MDDNAKCFIKIKKDFYEEITYKELKNRRLTNKTYFNKRFIPVDGMLLEVSEDGYKDFYRDVERHKYYIKQEKKQDIYSIEKLKYDSEDFNNKDVIPDLTVNIEAEIEKKDEIDNLLKALSKLTAEEYQIIKTIFYSEESIRNYAKRTGIPFSTIRSRKEKILKKLKKILKN